MALKLKLQGREGVEVGNVDDIPSSLYILWMVTAPKSLLGTRS
jgi:hypothetical protein